MFPGSDRDLRAYKLIETRVVKERKLGQLANEPLVEISTMLDRNEW